MSSKQLESILKNIPSATVSQSQESVSLPNPSPNLYEATERVVAIVPQSLKDEIRMYLKDRKTETERTVILRGLKAIGFNIPNEWLIDKRKIRGPRK